MKRASYEQVCQWIDKSWGEVTLECVKNGFRKTEINIYQNNACVEDIETDSTDTEIPDELIHIIENFGTNSDQEFDGFE